MKNRLEKLQENLMGGVHPPLYVRELALGRTRGGRYSHKVFLEFFRDELSSRPAVF